MSSMGTGILEREEVADGQSYRVLLLEDDQDSAQATTNVLRQKGITAIDVASDVRAATQQMHQESYDAILADVDLGLDRAGRPSARGDEWLLAAPYPPSDAVAVLLTAHPDKIDKRADLGRRGVRVVVKGRAEEIALFEELAARAGEKQRVTKRLSSADGVRDSIQVEQARVAASIGSAVSEAAGALFLEWANSRSNADSPDFFYDNRMLSVRELSLEVANKTDVGKQILRMFVSHLRRIMGTR